MNSDTPAGAAQTGSDCERLCEPHLQRLTPVDTGATKSMNQIASYKHELIPTDALLYPIDGHITDGKDLGDCSPGPSNEFEREDIDSENNPKLSIPRILLKKLFGTASADSYGPKRFEEQATQMPRVLFVISLGAPYFKAHQDGA
ncbi:hypothetical protein HDU84_002370 [Entophlyctis sp. JEL0112]|nr:hypothetical protein HDU84_002370 [Entophlyctis sp. JEL0112]